MKNAGEKQSIKVLDARIAWKDIQLSTSLYRNPTNTSRNLSFNSHHPISCKRSTVCALLSRALTLPTDDEEKEREVGLVREMLAENSSTHDHSSSNSYPVYARDKITPGHRKIQTTRHKTIQSLGNQQSSSFPFWMALLKPYKGYSDRSRLGWLDVRNGGIGRCNEIERTRLNHVMRSEPCIGSIAWIVTTFTSAKPVERHEFGVSTSRTQDANGLTIQPWRIICFSRDNLKDGC